MAAAAAEVETRAEPFSDTARRLKLTDEQLVQIDRRIARAIIAERGAARDRHRRGLV